MLIEEYVPKVQNYQDTNIIDIVFYSLRLNLQDRHRSTPTRQANSATQARTQTETRQATTVGNKLTKPQGPRQPLTKPWNSLFKTTTKTNARTNARRDNSRNDRRNSAYNYNNTKPHATELSDATTKEIQKLRDEIAELTADKSNYATPKNSPGVSSQRRDTGNPATNRKHQTTRNTRRHTNRDINSNNNENFNRIQKLFRRTTTHKADPFGNVINLSNKSFTYNDFKLLNKNLNFIPNPGRYNKHTIEKDTTAFSVAPF